MLILTTPSPLPTHIHQHHGEVVVHQPFAAGLVEIVDWCQRNTDELVVLFVTACSGSNCTVMAEAALQTAGLPIISDCSVLAGLTLAAARNLSRLPSGGLAAAITGPCVDEKYDPSIECYLFEKGSEYVCYDNSTKSVPVSKLWSYLNASTAIPAHTSDGQLWMAQGHWQYSASSVTAGTLRGSSILADEAKANVNAMLTAAVTAGQFPFLNLLEVDNVCDHGLELLAALRARPSRLAAAAPVQARPKAPTPPIWPVAFSQAFFTQPKNGTLQVPQVFLLN